MNSRFQKRSGVIQAGTITLLALLLVGSVLAGLFPQTAAAQQQKDDLFLRLLTNDSYTEITAGETKVLLLQVENTGSQAINDIQVSAIPPEGWTVDLQPDRIASLDRADSTVVKVTVKTPPKSAKKSYEIILRADSSTVHRATSAWMTVALPEGRWLWVGGIVAALVVAVFVVLFIRFGRD